MFLCNSKNNSSNNTIHSIYCYLIFVSAWSICFCNQRCWDMVNSLSPYASACLHECGCCCVVVLLCCCVFSWHMSWWMWLCFPLAYGVMDESSAFYVGSYMVHATCYMVVNPVVFVGLYQLGKHASRWRQVLHCSCMVSCLVLCSCCVLYWCLVSRLRSIWCCVLYCVLCCVLCLILCV